MGCASSTSQLPEDELRSNRSREIDHSLREQAKDRDKVTKLLMIGAGDTGKTTFLRQVSFIHTQSSLGTPTENKRLLNKNIMQSIQELIRASESLGIPFSQDNRDAAVRLAQYPLNVEPLTPEILQDIVQLRSDAAMPKLFDRSNEFNAGSNFLHFLENAEKLGALSYTPAEQDILLCRNKTTGVTEFQFLLDKKPFILVDVGGQRTERKKWIHSFENVNCLIFFASLSEYDQKLEEDLRVNRMHESLRLFQEVANSKWFTHVPFALMLNKRDLLAQKIKLRDLRIAFPEYSGGSDYQQALDYITTRFLSLNKTSTRKIYAHVSCATDTACVKQIFGLIAEHALKLAMEHAL